MGRGRFRRIVGLVIVAAAGSASVLVSLAAVSGVPVFGEHPASGVLLGVWSVRYDARMPAVLLIVAAVSGALLIAGGVALLERTFSNRLRRSLDPGNPLAPRIVMASTRGVYAGPVTVTVVIPAHNEEASLPLTLAALLGQSHFPERVIVVADNCTDGTVAIARDAGVEVFETVQNTRKKAGALNQTLEWLLPEQGDNDVVMVMDADTRLDDGFIEAAVRRFSDDRALMAVGGLFHGEPGRGLLGQLQRNEYIRYAREIRRRRGRVYVLTGTASMFRPAALRAVARNRGLSVPGTPGDVYDTAALTEDNELTIALKSLGALMISPVQCTTVTELMPSWRALWAQRLRWQRGALENIGAYGITSQTLRYWAQQLGIAYSVAALGSYFLLLTLMVLALDDWIWFPFWLGLGVLFSIERVVTVWRGGWRARLLALVIFPELIFDLFLNVVYVKGIVDITLGRRADWKHVIHRIEDRERPVVYESRH
ncbi:glycosyltransferase family 2 protein [Arthrobacter bambusae]|uniref:Cellulose synthase/poly-beta-1,6-N-acetylglucosamine synthase-like glycosyltransferase n=1 Tax=Arthrobacter bambusae TaxID=1338426 RepID=A0AAW8DIM8_9MICC|nr:glycosyltransferase family 2 protein [Arthrobacter bambusae]MDP9904683.1 cellulose synthase/poly-beta-1,6-N-acetylglucosamine synthase-like glycosyltransferase [Arthrobacter bambusae]MDQ0129499.1 cellulose synthase/poly-beta-1,6-N-acetylglucosamine synthase-like glycosyltransferase [Arthrobacter bambusae]MDQ0180888.1 cellulose synthase/poly-beta-1,6-N-acetylglucosamine synthase-like glycosyltransferase [Arthrobacter bambusae]